MNVFHVTSWIKFEFRLSFPLLFFEGLSKHHVVFNLLGQVCVERDVVITQANAHTLYTSNVALGRPANVMSF